MLNILVTLVGASGVGKTSLLAAIYDYLSHHPDLNLQETRSLKELSERVAELKKMLTTFQVKDGVSSTQEPSTFVFNLSGGGTPYSWFQLEVFDAPGNYYTRDYAVLDQQLQRSLAVVVPIDAAALMENNGIWHESLNQAQRTIKLLKRTYQNSADPRLLIFAPIKCEKYIRDSENASRLCETVKARYEELLSYLRNQKSRTVAVVITPVQTVGGVTFSWLEENQGLPNFYFRKCDAESTYEPQNVAELLQYLANFLLNHHKIDGQQAKLLNFFKAVLNLNLDHEFEEIAHKLSQTSHHAKVSEIVQGKHLLK